MEYNGVNSGDQTDIAEMLNSFFTEIGPSLSRDVTKVDKSFDDDMFLHYYQSFVSQRQLD